MQRLASLLAWALGVVVIPVTFGCANDVPTPPPQPWTGFFHPPPRPGTSITHTKQCECRACDPANCCGADQTEQSGPPPSECTQEGNYIFPETCGITVQSCTPRCYSKVWRVAARESCSDSRPLVCCE